MQTNQDDIISTGWIENLALEEINMDESGVIQFNDHLDTNIFLEESSIQMIDTLRDRFELYATRFNEYRSNPGNSIRIFKISNTVNDFMLFRNSLKLVIARKSHTSISIGFLSNTGSPFAARLNCSSNISENTHHELKAHVGPFNEISWRFLGEPVNVDSLVKHYLSEFIRYSAR